MQDTASIDGDDGVTYKLQFILGHVDVYNSRDREFVLAAVQEDGCLLGSAADEFKADREIVLAAVRESKAALKYMSEELQQDEELRKLVWRFM